MSLEELRELTYGALTLIATLLFASGLAVGYIACKVFNQDEW